MESGPPPAQGQGSVLRAPPSKKYYIQSAYDIPGEEKWLQETRSYDKVSDSFKKIVLVKNPVVPHHDEKGYFIIGLLDFLLNENSLESDF